jgi:hypothetical protein
MRLKVLLMNPSTFWVREDNVQCFSGKGFERVFKASFAD